MRLMPMGLALQIRRLHGDGAARGDPADAWPRSRARRLLRRERALL